MSYPRLSWMVRSPFRSSLRITKSRAHRNKNNALPSSYSKLISVASSDHRKATCHVIPVVGETSGECMMSYDILYISMNNIMIWYNIIFNIWLWYHIGSYFHHVAQSLSCKPCTHPEPELLEVKNCSMDWVAQSWKSLTRSLYLQCTLAHSPQGETRNIRILSIDAGVYLHMYEMHARDIYRTTKLKSNH